MNAEIINLRRVKKKLARAASEKNADANRVKFGRSKLENSTAKIEQLRASATLDGKKRET